MAVTRVYYCSYCEKFYHGDSSTCDLVCTTCGRNLDFVNIDYATFSAMSEEERETIKKQYAKSHRADFVRAIPFVLLYALIYSLITASFKSFFDISLGGIPTVILLALDYFLCKFLYNRHLEKLNSKTVSTDFKSISLMSLFRSAASLILCLFLWFVLYIAFVFACASLLVLIPSLVNIVDFLAGVLHLKHLYMVLLMGIPAIIPALIYRHIMKSTSDRVQKWTLILLIAVTSALILFSSSEVFNLIDKIEGIFGVVSTYYAFGKE